MYRYPAAKIHVIGDAPADEPDDATLFAAWADGDRDAGTRLVRRYFAGVYGFFRTRLPEQAEDLAQRTFLACVENREAYRGDGSFRAYVYGIARRQMLRTLEKKEIVERRSAHHGEPLRPTTPSGVVARHEEQVLVMRALRTLGTDDQMLVQLYYWERLSTEEIATVMDLGRSAVKVRLHRARGKLKDAISTDAAPAPLRTRTLNELERWAERDAD